MFFVSLTADRYVWLFLRRGERNEVWEETVAKRMS